MKYFLPLVALILFSACAREAVTPKRFDLILRGGTIYDGTGSPGFVGDIALEGDRIAAVGDMGDATADGELDVSNLAVSPGFINMLSWATESLLEDGLSQADIRQGVTLEVFGEGWSMGPVNDFLAEEMVKLQTDIKYDVTWKTLGGYLEHLEQQGISPNVASFVGATTVRMYVLGYEDRGPTDDELDQMQALVREAMEEGAVGLGSSLIYAPAFYANTEELVALAKVASEYGGMYISHLRSEGNTLLESLDELLTISRSARVPAEIYHLKAAGQNNWKKMESVLEKVEQARTEESLRITADMYTYTAGATGLDASMPPWVQEGGPERWRERLLDPEIRGRVKKEMLTSSDEWENLFLAAGPEKMILLDFRREELRHLQGSTLAEVAAERGQDPADVAMDLVLEDESRVGVAYFLMTEENLRKQMARPWVSFGSDADSPATDGVFVKTSRHPRAYGNFSRLLARYVRDEGVLTLADAIHRLTGLPAENLGIRNRGRLEPGYFADITVFDPETIQDHSTYEKPHQYSTGTVHVFVNGEQVLRHGEHTGALPGRVVRGPGWPGHEKNQ